MSKIIAFFLIAFACLTVFIDAAEAARFGGGRSFGVQRSYSGFSRAQSSNRAYSQPAAGNRWAAPLTGMALGGLMAYLMMGHGFGSGILTWLVLLSLGFMILNFIRSKQQVSAQTNANPFGRGRVFDAPSYTSTVSDFARSTPRAASFDTDAFLRDAKAHFIRLQAAFDAKNSQDLREFTAPEVFAEIQLQLQERGQADNFTEVVSLNADLLNTGSDQQGDLASVKFSGVIREAQNQPANFFEEVWHFRKTEKQGKWLVAGVQQQS